jgi:hypothetical protein
MKLRLRPSCSNEANVLVQHHFFGRMSEDVDLSLSLLEIFFHFWPNIIKYCWMQHVGFFRRYWLEFKL